MKEVIKSAARHLRKNQTNSEAIFWEAVRNRNYNGLKFLRQHPIKFNYFGEDRFFIADFYCAEKKLVIEIDGKIHEKQKEYDKLRTYIINQLGMKVIRIKNEDFITKSVADLLTDII